MIARQLSQRNSTELDAELLHRARNGQPEAVIWLLRRNSNRLRAIVRRLLALRLRSMLDPSDVVQDVAVVLLSKPLPGWITAPTDFSRYVGGIAKNLALLQNRKHLDGRHHSRNREVPLAAVRDIDFPASQVPNPIESMVQKESETILLDWLPMQVREIVTWICAGYSVAEVAIMYQIDEDTVVQFVCVANNFGPHAERKLRPAEVLRLFRSRTRRPPKKFPRGT